MGIFKSLIDAGYCGSIKHLSIIENKRKGSAQIKFDGSYVSLIWNNTINQWCRV